MLTEFFFYNWLTKAKCSLDLRGRRPAPSFRKEVNVCRVLSPETNVEGILLLQMNDEDEMFPWSLGPKTAPSLRKEVNVCRLLSPETIVEGILLLQTIDEDEMCSRCFIFYIYRSTRPSYISWPLNMGHMAVMCNEYSISPLSSPEDNKVLNIHFHKRRNEPISELWS